MRYDTISLIESFFLVLARRPAAAQWKRDPSGMRWMRTSNGYDIMELPYAMRRQI